MFNTNYHECDTNYRELMRATKVRASVWTLTPMLTEKVRMGSRRNKK